MYASSHAALHDNDIFMQSYKINFFTQSTIKSVQINIIYIYISWTKRDLCCRNCKIDEISAKCALTVHVGTVEGRSPTPKSGTDGQDCSMAPNSDWVPGRMG